MLHLCQGDLVLSEGRVHQYVGKNSKASVDVLFQHGHRGESGIQADARLDRGGEAFELFVEFVAGLCDCTAGSHDCAGDVGQAELVGGLIYRSDTDSCRDVDERQLVIFQQKQSFLDKWSTSKMVH